MKTLKRRLRLAALSAGLAGAAWGQAIVDPVDQLRSDYRNEVHDYSQGETKLGVTLGPGAGREYKSNPSSLPNYQSAIGVPITVQPANINLGEKLEPPTNWSGEKPTIENSSGMLVWIDYAKTVIAIEAGTVTIKWPLAGGGTEETAGVVSASPSKRPVRLYWTHQRPNSVDDTTYRTLQNSGPTVSFGSNYRVTLYETGNIKVWNDDESKGDVHVGDVRLNGNELQAFEGSSGTFLITYSRLDEATGVEVLLAYELVEVLRPMQTQIDVKIGQQLRPITRTYETEELYPSITRGLTDDADNGEIYVYQHGQGKQKNYIWAIRDSSKDPWKIEVYWRAKEELDVVWPFEVDIYAASWDEKGSQVYARDCATAAGGEAPAEPIVLMPTATKATVMDYQVPKAHFYASAKGFYSDYADDYTFALIKYTAGETVWFQTIRSVPAKNTALLRELGVDLVGLCTNRVWWTGEEDEKSPDPADVQYATLAEEIRAPFAGAKGFYYPGWIKKASGPEPGYPVPNPYNDELYAYPKEYTITNSLYAPIFPVNLGKIDIWWQLPCKLNDAQPAETGHTGPLTSPIYFPTCPCTYEVGAPVEMYRWDNGVPQIVLASGLGSSSLALSDYDPYVASPSIRFNENWGAPLDGGLVVANLAQSAVTSDSVTNFTVEARFTVDKWDYPSNDVRIPWAAFFRKGEAKPDLEIGFDLNANLYLGETKVTAFDAIPNPIYANRTDDCPMVEFHLAVVRGKDGKWLYYVNGMRAAIIDQPDGVAEGIVLTGGQVRLFRPNDAGLSAGCPQQFVGCMSGFRVWSCERLWQEIHNNRYSEYGNEDSISSQPANLVVQFGEQKPLPGHEDEEQWEVRTRLEDSSLYGNHGELAYVPDQNGELITAGLLSGAPLKPRKGLVLDQDATIYRQCDRSKPGYNPNEEHATMVNGVVHALRCDLNVTDTEDDAFTSLPYVLATYAGSDGRARMAAYRVVPENDRYRFREFLEAGHMIQAPNPIAALQPANLMDYVSGPTADGMDTCFKDRKGWFWAQQAGDDGDTANYVFEFSYPHQEVFDFPEGKTKPAVGDKVKWLEWYAQRDDGYLGAPSAYPKRSASDTGGIDYTFIVRWPDSTPKLYINQTLYTATAGLPEMRNQLSVRIAYEQSTRVSGERSVKVIDPTVNQYGSLEELPAEIKSKTYLDNATSKRHFDYLSPFMQQRFVFNPNAKHDLAGGDTRELELSGTFREVIGIDSYLWLNVMDARSRQLMCDEDAFPGGSNTDWQKGVASVPTNVVEMADENTPHDTLALITTGVGAGYVTLVMNNATNLAVVPDQSENISMTVIRVVPELWSSTIDPIESRNPLDKKVNMKYTADFGGTPELWEFEWKCADPLTNGGAPSLPDTEPAKWTDFSSQVKSGTTIQDWITVGDEGVFGLSDHYITCRYRPKDPRVRALVGDEWSKWCSAQLFEGWIKRVLKAVNPFEQRCKNYADVAATTELNTQLSMIQQAGAPYEGDVPLNQYVLNDYGLIQFYETVLHEAKKLSIDTETHQAFGSLALALQMAAGRIAELYVVLGNEALADAMNPTVDLGTDSPVDDGAESSIFPFMNVCENLLDEELCLLRGRDMSYDYAYAAKNKVEPWASPYYNRLIWNFSSDIMGGQVAYVLNYGITDLKGDQNGLTDVNDAAAMYPQGHGDAYGHYLSAVKGYYSLLRHKNFGWPTQVESILGYGSAALISCSYMHEKRFASAAAQKARTAEMIVSRTARWHYEQGAQDPWLWAEDDQLDQYTLEGKTETRHWGVDEWATRGHLGAYYDWLAVNAVLPTTNATDVGILQLIDRDSTLELGEIAQYAKNMQRDSDQFDAGLNPLGLADAAVPFDISPSDIDNGKTHFEQIYDRALRATTVAHEIFKRVKNTSNALRDQNEERDFETMVADEEAAINRELIEIYGRPYEEDIGPGQLYEQGYTGPDLYHYYYVETYDVDGSNKNPVKGRYLNLVIDNYTLTTTNAKGTYEAEIDTSITNGTGLLSALLVGAANLYNKAATAVSEKVNPYLKYASYIGVNVKAEDYLELPVEVIDTGSDEFDGKVDYEFAVAAWINNQYNASYFVGVDGFVPKPSNYTSQRAAEGSLQIALAGYQDKLSAIEEEQAKVKAITVAVKAKIDELGAEDFNTQIKYVEAAATNEVANYYAAVQKNAETAIKLVEKMKDIKSIISDSIAEALPKVTGLSFDLTSIARGAEMALKAGLMELLDMQIAEQEDVVEKIQTATEKMQANLEKQYKSYQDGEERKKKVAAIKEKASELSAAVAKLESALNIANAQRMQYSQLLEKGNQLQAERKRLRVQWASDLALRRYRNMFYQILRNDELQRYNEAFESAAKYTYLAAKAYDYETGLLQSDAKNAAGREFMSQIIKSRALGRFSTDGSLPLGGGSAGDPGLADVLYRMNENWQVLKGRLGFNNPQNELDGFSLRKELFRKNSDAEGDAAWKDLLQSYWVADIKSHPAFTRLAQPFSPMQTQEPGFAIPFQTVIAARTGFFGNELKEGDNAFSSTYFATKIRGVGVWLEGEGGRVANHPEVYLIPTGLDYMRVPVRSSSSEVAEVRAWDVVDQVLPIPYPFSDAQWQSTDWSMMKDIFANELCAQRRHPTIRAAVSPSFAESGMSYNARLIGRSVWNDRWWLIIPAASLHSDDETARKNFVETVKDIHLYLKTYSFSGN